MSSNEQRLDAAESVFFKRQLESIDTRVYTKFKAETKARLLIPTQDGVDEDARVHTWRMFDHYGQAKFISNAADDLPTADADGEEQSTVIKPLGLAYGWDIFEIKAAAKGNFDLGSERAMATRAGIERLIDDTLATGDAVYGLEGILNLTGVGTYTLGTKAAGGLTWAVATPDEIVADVTGAITARKLALKGAGGPEFEKFTVVLPIDKYGLIAQRRMGDGSSTTILQFLLATSPWIDSIESWTKCSGAGAGSTDRMLVYAKDPTVVSALVPMEYRTLPAEQRNLRYVVNAVASTGGVICRYPVGVVYADGL